MKLPHLSTPLQALHKLEREMHRAFHHGNYVHKADHLYNFCVTALSLKDALLTHAEIADHATRKRLHLEWATITSLRAATEIANTSKHFELRKAPATKGVTPTRSTITLMLLDEECNFVPHPELAPDYTVTLQDGIEIGLYEFTREIIEFWRQELDKYGIAYEPQPEAQFFGENDP